MKNVMWLENLEVRTAAKAVLQKRIINNISLETIHIIQSGNSETDKENLFEDVLRNLFHEVLTEMNLVEVSLIEFGEDGTVNYNRIVDNFFDIVAKVNNFTNTLKSVLKNY